MQDLESLNMKAVAALSILLLFTAVLAAEEPANSVNQESQSDPNSFTLIVLPDTQGYADVRHKETQKHWPDTGDQRSCFFKQTEWIKENAQKKNIVMAVHVGDITQTQHDEEWEIADTAFKTIDDHVPYILCSGNHDMGLLSRTPFDQPFAHKPFRCLFSSVAFYKEPVVRIPFRQERRTAFL